MAGPPRLQTIDSEHKARPVDVLVGPFRRFARYEAAGGILLLLITVVALVWANSEWSDSYTGIWYETLVSIGVGEWGLEKPLVIWINDLLMAVFFLVVGLEIKRELLVGELSSVRKATIPLMAAIGGMVVPAGIYAALNMGQESMRGWGVPMATDIAFALGVLALLGSRVPVGLRIFLTSLAIVDDLGALLVIAIFYTENLKTSAMMNAGVCLILLGVLNVIGVRRILAYMLVGAVLWYFVLKSGVHATIAGVLVAAFVPARERVNTSRFVDFVRMRLNGMEEAGESGKRIVSSPRMQSTVQSIEDACLKVQTPLHQLEFSLIGMVFFLIVPVFALANAGVAIAGEGGKIEFSGPIAWGVTLGLTLGKPIGVFLFTYGAVKLGIGSLPTGVRWAHVHGAAWLSGIGFTMALFIANLAFPDQSDLDMAKRAVLAASGLAAIVGLGILAMATRDSACEAE